MASQEYNRRGFFPASADAKTTLLKIAASQSLEAGDVVALSSGKVAIATASSATLCGVVAQKCSSLAEDTLVPVYADPDEIFIGVADADSSSLVAGSEADLVGTTGAMMIDASASTTDVFKLIAPISGETTSSAYAAWTCKINKHDFAQID